MPPDRKGGSDRRPRTLDDDWLPEVDRWFNEFIPRRSDIVIDSLGCARTALCRILSRLAGASGGLIQAGFELEMSAASLGGGLLHARRFRSAVGRWQIFAGGGRVRDMAGSTFR